MRITTPRPAVMLDEIESSGIYRDNLMLSADVLRTSRQRTDADWFGAVASLQERGWLDEAGVATELGRERRRWIEQRTDELSVGPYAAIGEDRCGVLRKLGRPWSTAMMGAFAG